MPSNQYLIEITKESGEVIATESFGSEISAHDQFEAIERIKYPLTYKGHVMNLSEYPENRIGSVRVVVINNHGRLVRRELFRKP